MRLLGGEGGGFHIRGNSSTGKTTILRAAGSVWGGGGELGFAQSWRSTDNALEAIALAHNDCLLALDELRQLEPDRAGAAAYTLATGVAKARLRADAEMKARPTWCTMVLSAGELSLADMIRMSRGGDRSYAGQELRLLDLDADLGAGLGAWQSLYGSADAGGFSDDLRAATSANYGQAGPLFVEQIAGRRDELIRTAKSLEAAFIAEVCLPGDTGQVRRAAHRFALPAVAGELAALLDVTPWRRGEASKAAAVLFERWARRFGRASVHEDREAVRRVKAFLEKYGASSFRWLKDGLSDDEQMAEELQDQLAAEAGKQREGEARSMIMAGFMGTKVGEGLVYHFNTEFMKETVLIGTDWQRGIRALKAAGYLVSNGEEGKRLTNKVKVPGFGPRNFYSVRATILNADVDHEAA